MPFTEVAPGVLVWPNTCNTYVVRDGDVALVVDLGDGSVLDALAGIGVTTVEWVLYTHHHREQCQGHGLLATHATCRGVRVAGPAAERELFETPLAFRQAEPKLSDRFTVRAVERVANARAVLPEGPDMILVDGGLEEADPYEIAANLKKPLKKAVAVILTSRFHPWDEKRAAKAGLEHHIDKPFETDAFRARLDVLMGREPLDPPSAAAMVLKANPKTRTPKPAPAAPSAPSAPASLGSVRPSR